MGRTQVAVLLSVMLGAAPAIAAAADTADSSVTAASNNEVRDTSGSALQRVVFTQPAASRQSDSRPALLPALYVGSALLQGFDAYSTLSALRQGGVEANPLARGMTANPAAFIAVKSSVAFLSIYAAEKLWREHHRAGAIALMAISNGAMAAVALHNASALRSLQQ
jgi:hypothetical protein